MKYLIRAFSTVDGKSLYYMGGTCWTVDANEAALFTSERASRATVALLIEARVIRGETVAGVFAATEQIELPPRQADCDHEWVLGTDQAGHVCAMCGLRSPVHFGKPQPILGPNPPPPRLPNRIAVAGERIFAGAAVRFGRITFGQARQVYNLVQGRDDPKDRAGVATEDFEEGDTAVWYTGDGLIRKAPPSGGPE